MSRSYSLFLGCYIPAVQPFAEVSLRRIAPLLGIKLLDIKGATCCPVPEIVRLADKEAWLSVAARNLSLAEQIGKDIMVLCNGCWESLYESRETLLHDQNLMDDVNSRLSLLGKEFVGKIGVKHFVEILAFDIGLDKLKKAIKRPLSGLNIVAQYGCKFYKSDDEKFVTYFDAIVNSLGVKLLHYKTERVCCGYPTSYDSLDLAVEERAKWKLDHIQDTKADCIVTTCAGCYDFLEKAQFLLKRKGLKYNIPMLNLTELIALSFGFSPKEIGLNKHRIRCDAIVEKLGLEGV